MAEKEDEEQPARSFKVADRRRFVDDTESTTASGEPDRDRTDDAERAAESSPASGASPSFVVGRETDAEAGAAEHGSPPEMSFSSFVIGLTTQALMHLGEIADPLQQQAGPDLPAAKQMIDLLGILRDKTRNNLDQHEEQLLENMLYDLRIRYVEASRSR